MKTPIHTILCMLCTTLGLITSLHETCHAQSICQIDYYSTANGLAQRSVVGMAQDCRGFMWFSTWNGLSRWDGYTFKNYKAHPGDGCRLTSNRIPYITPTGSGDIWCQTHDNHAFLFDTRQERFIDPLQPIERKQGHSYNVRRIVSLEGGISWIICSQGAFRVDEQQLKQNPAHSEALTQYSRELGNLPGDSIGQILRDTDGDEWVLTNRGLLIVGRKEPADTTTSYQYICQMGTHIYLTDRENHLTTYSLRERIWQTIRIPAPTRKVNGFTPMGTDTLGIGTNDGVMLYLPRTQTFRHLDTSLPGVSNETYTFFPDSHGQLWLLNHDEGITRYVLATGEKQHYRTSTNEMPDSEYASRTLAFEDRQGTVWVVPRGGALSYYDPQSRTLLPYLSDPARPESKFLPVIRSYAIDGQGNFWFSDRSHLGKVTFHPNGARLLPLDSGYETRAFLTDRQGRLWVASKEGSVRIYRPDGTLQGYLTPNGSISSRHTSFGASIYVMREDKTGKFYLGSRWDGLFRLTPQPSGIFQIDHFVHQADHPASLSENSIYDLLEDRDGRLWIATHGGGLNLMLPAGEKNGQTRFLHAGNGLKHYPGKGFNRARSLHQAPDGTLLMGTTDGLVTFCPDPKQVEETRFQTYTRIPDDPQSLSCNDVTHIYSDSRGKTYVLTFSGGVNCIEPGSSLTAPHIHFQPLPTDGTPPPTDVTLSMLEDNEGSLWIVSEALLMRYRPEEHKFEFYNQKSLLLRDTYFSEAIPVQWGNLLVFGAEDGMVHINPQTSKPNPYTPPIVFTQLRLAGSQQLRPLNDVQEVHLSPRERNITIEFAALDYTDPSAIRYAYRLEGLEEEWNESGNTRRASYANLPPGTYHLQVRSTNADGIANPNVASLTLVVTPTFWETPWATICYALLFVLLATAISLILLYIYRLRHRINLEQQLADLKLRFFTDVSHELRTPLTLISSPLNEVIENEPLTPQAHQLLSLVQRNTRRMLRLVNQILDFRKLENKKMKLLLEHIEVVSLVQQVMETFRPLAAEKQIELQLTPAPESLILWLDRDKVEKMLFNLLSNAFKYTPQGKHITLGLRTEEGRLLISVRDEGIGISPEKQAHLFERFETIPQAGLLQPSSGIGLSLVREFVKLHLGTIQLQSRQGEGSTFTISLPLDPDSYRNHPMAEFILDESSKENLDGADSIPAETEEERGSEEVEASHTRILLVEDNEELRGFLSTILSSNYQTLEATNGEEGLAMALEQQPDLILTDVMMPQMDGLELVKALKGNRNTSHIPIIILSAKSSLDDRIEGLEQGIDDYITKPFSSSYLKARIRTLLQQRSILQAWYLEQLTRESQSTTPLSPTVTDTPEGEQTSPTLSAIDQEFLELLNQHMDKLIDQSELTIDELAQAVGMSRTVFYQKVKTTLGITPVDFIREKRLLHARKLLEKGGCNVSTAAYMSGFNDPKYFSKCYKKRFGYSPSQQTEERQEPER